MLPSHLIETHEQAQKISVDVQQSNLKCQFDQNEMTLFSTKVHMLTTKTK